MPQQLDRAAFRDWLAAMPEDAVAGWRTKDPVLSPIKIWLTDTGYEPQSPVTPDWAWELSLAAGWSGQPITAAECIQILDAIQGEE